MEQGIIGGRYEVLEHIGGGGMADVYKAHDRILERIVAVKILHQQLAGDREFLRKFQQEAQGAAKLSHPNIVGIYDVGQDGDRHYIIMEYVSGTTLKEHIEREGKLRTSEALRITREIAGALAHAHANDLVHCDIKPHNILLTSEGRVKVADFGIARAVSSATMTFNGDVVGSVHYFSPEQAKGTKITTKSDVYSLGVVLYEMLTGTRPYDGETTVSVAIKHLQEEARAPRSIDPSIPPIVEAIVMKAMSKAAEERPDATELIKDVRRAEQFLGYAVGTAADDDMEATVMMRPVRGGDERYADDDEEDAYDEEDEEETSSAYRPFYRRKAFLITLLSIIFAGFALGAFLSYGKIWSTGETTVPNVAGKKLTLAKQLLEAENLRVHVVEISDDEVEAGIVVSQSPEGGSVVKTQRQITIRVSSGSEEVTMPDLKGLTRNAAEEKLKKIGLSIGNIQDQESSVAVGTVISHVPASGARIQKGKSVALIISKGKPVPIVRVPKFTGSTVEAARKSLQLLKLNLGKIETEKSTSESGTILRQDPPAGSVAQEGASIHFVVSEKETRKGGTGKNNPPSPENRGGKTK